jgi:hypothetical protein
VTADGSRDRDNVVAAHTTTDAGIARLLASFLQDQRISCNVCERIVLKGGLVSISPRPGIAYDLLVFEEDAVRARRLIGEFLASGGEEG